MSARASSREWPGGARIRSVFERAFQSGADWNAIVPPPRLRCEIMLLMSPTHTQLLFFVMAHFAWSCVSGHVHVNPERICVPAFPAGTPVG